jgi:hypothetical protein
MATFLLVDTVNSVQTLKATSSQANEVTYFSFSRAWAPTNQSSANSTDGKRMNMMPYQEHLNTFIWYGAHFPA